MAETALELSKSFVCVCVFYIIFVTESQLSSFGKDGFKFYEALGAGYESQTQGRDGTG